MYENNKIRRCGATLSILPTSLSLSLRQTGLLDLIPRSCGRKRVVLGSVGVGGVGAGGDVSEGGNMWSGVGVS